MRKLPRRIVSDTRLLILFGLHTMAFFTEGRKVGKAHGLGLAESLAQCLAFGFTWWLPLKKSE